MFFLKTLIRALTFIAAVCLAAPIHAQSLRASFSAVANFAYQLDCVSGVARTCAGADDYRELWKTELGVDSETAAPVQRWVKLRSDYAADTRRSGEDKSPLPSATLNLSRRPLVAGLTAKDVADYCSRLTLLFDDRMGTDATEIVNALYPAFERWWLRQGEVEGRANAQALSEALATPLVKSQVRDVFNFYGQPQRAQAVATVHLMFRPGKKNQKTTSGESFGRESLAEFLGDKVASDATSVLLHEYAHFVFGTSELARAQALKDSVLQAGGDFGTAVWELLNESVATALGNGRIYRSMIAQAEFDAYAAKSQSFYANPNIDAAAKAILPLLDRTIDSGGTLFDDAFVRGYVEAVRQRLGATFETPAAFMKSYTIVIDEPLGGADAWAKHFSSHSRWTWSESCCGSRFAEAKATRIGKSVTVMAVKRANLPKFAASMALPNPALQELEAALSPPGTTGAVLVVRNPATPPYIIVVADDAVAFERAAVMVSEMPALRSGVMVIP
jgi:hypothetical protein